MRKNHQIGSVMNFATTNDQVWRYFSRLNQEALDLSLLFLSSTSLLICLRSASFMRWIFSGTLYSGYQNNSQIKPATPAATNAACQPQAAAINGTVAGATIAPTLV